jgi:hypothetical protein
VHVCVACGRFFILDGENGRSLELIWSTCKDFKLRNHQGKSDGSSRFNTWARISKPNNDYFVFCLGLNSR